MNTHSPGTDIASRVATGVQALAVPGQREGWQAQHNGSMLNDAQGYDALADALYADLRKRRVDGDMPWSALLRARRRVAPLRKTARAMRRAAREVSGTAAAYEETRPETVAKRRHDKALAKAQRKAVAHTAVQNSAHQTLQRLAPADDQADTAGSGQPKLLGDFFGGNQQRRGA